MRNPRQSPSDFVKPLPTPLDQGDVVCERRISAVINLSDSVRPYRRITSSRDTSREEGYMHPPFTSLKTSVRKIAVTIITRDGYGRAEVPVGRLATAWLGYMFSDSRAADRISRWLDHENEASCSQLIEDRMVK